MPLGARARTVLKSLSEPGQPKAAEPEVKPEPAPAPMSPEELAARQQLRAARRALKAATTAAENGGSAVAPAAGRAVAPRPANTVVALPRRDGARRELAPAMRGAIAPARSVKAKGRTNYIRISALLAIALPTMLAAVYYTFIAAPQYVAEARFAVRGPDDSPGAADALGALTGLSAGASSTTADSYIVSQFIESSQLVSNLQKSIDLRKVYTSERADFVAKYRPYDFEDTIEHLTIFWNSVSWVYFEPISGVITFTVRAFTPDDALRIARDTIRESEKLVNKLTERAREDAIALAKQEQSRAELRLKFARKAVQEYRDRMGETDPVTAATAKSTLIANLEAELAKQEADIAGRSAFLNKDAPSIRVLRQQIDSIRSQIEREKSKIGGQAQKDAKTKGLISANLTEFEALQTERDIAQVAYNAATTSVESTRMRAEQQARYLTTFVEPHLPEDSLYPARMQMILLVLLCSALAWAIGVLIFYGIRDHTA